jgi:hypothetical protein
MAIDDQTSIPSIDSDPYHLDLHRLWMSRCDEVGEASWGGVKHKADQAYMKRYSSGCNWGTRWIEASLLNREGQLADSAEDSTMGESKG